MGCTNILKPRSNKFKCSWKFTIFEHNMLSTKSSLCSRYYTEACNEWRDSSRRLGKTAPKKHRELAWWLITRGVGGHEFIFRTDQIKHRVPTAVMDLWSYRYVERALKLYWTENLTVIEGDCKVSLRSSSQQPPCICQMRSAPAANRTRHVGSVTCARYRSVVSLSAVEIDPPLVTRFDVIPQVKSHLHFVCLKLSFDALRNEMVHNNYYRKATACTHVKAK